MSDPSDSPGRGRGRSALVVAHPGHELRVHGWMEREHPRVFVLTDGSGLSGRSRLASSAALLGRVGAESGVIFGRLTDRQLYEAILDRDVSLFSALVSELAEAFVRERVTFVAGDGVEGHQPGHDVCRLLIDCAVIVAGRVRDAAIENYDFPVLGRPDVLGQGAVVLELDDAELARKLEAARAYSEMHDEVAAAIERFGVESFRRECFRPRSPAPDLRSPEMPPYYERQGAERLAAGDVRRLIRYDEHVAPLAEAVFAAAGIPAFVP